MTKSPLDIIQYLSSAFESKILALKRDFSLLYYESNEGCGFLCTLLCGKQCVGGLEVQPLANDGINCVLWPMKTILS